MTTGTDYRAENAKAGRAFFISGRTPKEIAADRAKEEEAAARPVTVTLSAGCADAAEVAIADEPHFLWAMANSLELLHGGIETGGIDPESPGLSAILWALSELARGRGDRLDPLFDKVARAMLDSTAGTEP